jgi:capsular exopolysaccharide synthesis family protein
LNRTSRHEKGLRVDLADSLRTIRKGARVIALCVLLGLGAALLYTFVASPVYSTSIQLFITTSDAAGGSAAALNGGVFAQQRTKSYVNLAEGPSLAKAVADKLGGEYTPAEVADTIQANAAEGTVLLTVAVSTDRPKKAQTIANAIGQQFPKLVDQLEKPSGGGASLVKVGLVQPAALPTSPVSPDPVRNLGAGFLLGLIIGVAIAVARERFDTTAKDESDIHEVIEAPGLGRISHFGDADRSPLVAHDEPGSLCAEEFRRLRTNLQALNTTGRAQSIVLTSAVPGEGTSTTVANLAITLAEAGMRVALVDADLRRPRVAARLGLLGSVGLTDVLVRQAAPAEVMQSWGDGDLMVLPSGPLPSNPSELVGSAAMADLIGHLRSEFDVVLIVAPPLLPVTDASVLAGAADGVVLVTRIGVTRRAELVEALASLELVRSPLLGFVVNGVRDARKQDPYGHRAEGTRTIPTAASPRRPDATSSVSVSVSESASASARHRDRKP